MNPWGTVVWFGRSLVSFLEVTFPFTFEIVVEERYFLCTVDRLGIGFLDLKLMVGFETHDIASEEVGRVLGREPKDQFPKLIGVGGNRTGVPETCKFLLSLCKGVLGRVLGDDQVLELLPSLRLVAQSLHLSIISPSISCQPLRSQLH